MTAPNKDMESAMEKLRDNAKWGPANICTRLSGDEAAALLRALATENAHLHKSLDVAGACQTDKNRQLADAFTASDAYQKRCEQGDALLREARDYVYDYGSEATMAPLVARIDAHLAGEDMGRRK